MQNLDFSKDGQCLSDSEAKDTNHRAGGQRYVLAPVRPLLSGARRLSARSFDRSALRESRQHFWYAPMPCSDAHVTVHRTGAEAWMQQRLHTAPAPFSPGGDNNRFGGMNGHGAQHGGTVRGMMPSTPPPAQQDACEWKNVKKKKLTALVSPLVHVQIKHCHHMLARRPPLARLNRYTFVQFFFLALDNRRAAGNAAHIH